MCYALKTKTDIRTAVTLGVQIKYLSHQRDISFSVFVALTSIRPGLIATVIERAQFLLPRNQIQQSPSDDKTLGKTIKRFLDIEILAS